MQDVATHPQLSIGEFEGPIELLLRMIQERKMPINDVSLSDVTDEYIQYINNYRTNDFSYITHFVYVASTLLLIKSRSLLPSLELTEEEEQSIDELQLRLRLFQLYSAQAQELKPLFAQPSMYTRPFTMRRIVAFSPDGAGMRIEAMSRYVTGLESQELTPPVLPEVRVRTASIHINDMVDDLKKRMTTALGKISFRDFTTPALVDATPQERKVYAVVGFLALLEMVKNGLAQVQQTGQFDDIMIEA